MKIDYKQITTFKVEFTEQEYTTLIGALGSFISSTEETKDNKQALTDLKRMKACMLGVYREAIEY